MSTEQERIEAARAWLAYRVRSWNAHTAEALAASWAEWEAKGAASEMALRKALWLLHGHFLHLYGDDGEMTCSKCMCDYKGEAVEHVIKCATKAMQAQRRERDEARAAVKKLREALETMRQGFAGMKDGQDNEPQDARHHDYRAGKLPKGNLCTCRWHRADFLERFAVHALAETAGIVPEDGE